MDQVAIAKLRHASDVLKEDLSYGPRGGLEFHYHGDEKGPWFVDCGERTVATCDREIDAERLVHLLDACQGFHIDSLRLVNSDGDDITQMLRTADSLIEEQDAFSRALQAARAEVQRLRPPCDPDGVLVGMLKLLPEPGAVFTPEDRELWMGMVESYLGFLYHAKEVPKPVTVTTRRVEARERTVVVEERTETQAEPAPAASIEFANKSTRDVALGFLLAHRGERFTNRVITDRLMAMGYREGDNRNNVTSCLYQALSWLVAKKAVRIDEEAKIREFWVDETCVPLADVPEGDRRAEPRELRRLPAPVDEEDEPEEEDDDEQPAPTGNVARCTMCGKTYAKDGKRYCPTCTREVTFGRDSLKSDEEDED
jgi:hypothetical protein